MSEKRKQVCLDVPDSENMASARREEERLPLPPAQKDTFMTLSSFAC
jgi:hypothetical protein